MINFSKTVCSRVSYLSLAISCHMSFQLEPIAYEAIFQLDAILSKLDANDINHALSYSLPSYLKQTLY